MPSPIELLLDPISLSILAIYAFLILWETLAPGRILPKVKYWKIRGLAVFFFNFFLSSYLPLLWNDYLAPFQCLDLTGIGTFGGSLVGILLLEFGIYVWHRTMHASDTLWKLCHQMHHSAERLDTFGAFYFSPLDMLGWTALSSLCFTLLVGLPPQAITITLLITNFFSLFQHANIKTPQWMGYLIQRPESHTVHHAKGIHAFNYSDLPLFDIMFGTFRNPKKFEHETGFYQGASKRITDMLLFKDIHHKPREEKDEVHSTVMDKS